MHGMKRNLVFVNSTGDTFTPTHSGAIATWIWEMCRAANEFGIEPWVFSRNSPFEAYPWSQTVELAYPHPPRIRGAGRLCGWYSRREGWAHIRQGAWIKRVLGAIKKRGLENSVIIFHNDPESVGALRPYLPDARLIHLFHNANHCREPWRARFGHSVDVALAVSAYCARWNEGYFGGAVHVLRNGVDVKRFAPVIKAESTRPLIGFVGRTDRQKGPDLLLRAALRLSEGFNGFDLQILGSRFYGSHDPDPYQNMLQTLASCLESRGVKVDRPGFVGRLALPRILAKADIHVVPSRWEDPCPLTVLEGMATGQAVVAAGCGGIPEIVGGAGFIFERDDVCGLEARLRVLLQNKNLRDAYGRRARERAEQRPWSRVFAELIEIINF